MNVRSISIQQNSRQVWHVTKSATETRTYAKRLLQNIQGGDVLALSGELGAGKTTFVQGLAQALEIKEQVTSPTFVLMKVYQLKKPFNGIAQLCHIDAYRLDSADELAAIGAGEYIGDAQTLTVIEWPERVYAMIPKQAAWICFSMEQRVDKLHDRFVIKTRRKKKDVIEHIDKIVYGTDKRDE